MAPNFLCDDLRLRVASSLNKTYITAAGMIVKQMVSKIIANE